MAIFEYGIEVNQMVSRKSLTFHQLGPWKDAECCCGETGFSWSIHFTIEKKYFLTSWSMCPGKLTRSMLFQIGLLVNKHFFYFFFLLSVYTADCNGLLWLKNTSASDVAFALALVDCTHLFFVLCCIQIALKASERCFFFCNGVMHSTDVSWWEAKWYRCSFECFLISCLYTTWTRCMRAWKISRN